MLDKAITLDFASQSVPYFIFFERTLTSPKDIILFKIDHDYGYFLRRVVAKYAGQYGYTLVPDITVEFIDPALGQQKQTSPYPFPHITTPSSGGNSEVSAVTNGVLGITCKTGKSSEKILNYYYPYADSIRIDVTGGGPIKGTYGALFYPTLWLMLDGYYIHEPDLAVWKGKGMY